MKLENIANNFGDLVPSKCPTVCTRVWASDTENPIARTLVTLVTSMYIWKNNNHQDKTFKTLF